MVLGGCAQEPVPPSIPEVSAPSPTPSRIPHRGAEKYRPTLSQMVNFYWGRGAGKAKFFAQVHVESTWQETVVSPAGASGLAQFMPGTAEWIQSLYPADFKDECASRGGCPLDAGWALRALTLYDKHLFDRLPWATGTDQFALALVGYNGGSGWVARERKEAQARGLPGTRWFGDIEQVCLRSSGACKESRAYPRKILLQWTPPYAEWLRES